MPNQVPGFQTQYAQEAQTAIGQNGTEKAVPGQEPNVASTQAQDGHGQGQTQTGKSDQTQSGQGQHEVDDTHGNDDIALDNEIIELEDPLDADLDVDLDADFDI